MYLQISLNVCKNPIKSSTTRNQDRQATVFFALNVPSGDYYHCPFLPLFKEMVRTFGLWV